MEIWDVGGKYFTLNSLTCAYTVHEKMNLLAYMDDISKLSHRENYWSIFYVLHAGAYN